MSFMFEVLYNSPQDAQREESITGSVRRLGGRLSYRETPPRESPSATVCLTYEFDELHSAKKAATLLRAQGEHVEGPVDYGP